MGVFKLWELLLTIAQPYQIDKLNGKIVAIDASIWIVRIDSGLTTNTDKIKSILNKIMLLKRNNILPVFVFDGTPPALKRKTLEQRTRRRIVTNDQQAKKKSQIEIMRIIEGDSSQRHSEKIRRISHNESELEVINEQLKKLSDFPQTAEEEVSQELLQKITLQSEILNTKYKIMLDLTPQYQHYPFFIPPEDYQGLDLELKQQYLDELQEFKWKHIKKDRRRQKLQMTEQQKLRHDISIIQKKSIIRQMQDNLFRKMMQKHVKIENGFEIVETIYDGKKVTQKRKIKEKNQTIGFAPLRKDKMKNDFGNIKFGEEKDSQSEAEEDPFVASFCQHSLTNSIANNSQQTQSAVQSQQQSNSRAVLQPKEQLPKNKKQRKSKVNQSSDSHNEQQQPYIPFQSQHSRRQEQPQTFVNAQEFQQKYSNNQSQSLNRDNLPNFNSEQHPSYLNSSNDNVELQNLFNILGLPFLVAPGEAEAQCAALEQEGIVDGVVTEDSDVFLFGAKNVYRGVFNNNIRHYNFQRMQQKLKMTREKLIIFAELLGSDYAEGVKGIGLVNAMEILKVFNTFDKLDKFKKWAERPDVLLPEQQTTKELLKLATPEEKQFYELHKKFKNYWYVNPSFGNKIIHQAYLHPDVLKPQQLRSFKVKHTFQEKPCKTQLLSKLLKQRLQMQDKQYDHYMKLLTLQFNSKRPNTLHNYFLPRKEQEEVELAKIKSKRLQKSINQPQPDKQ